MRKLLVVVSLIAVHANAQSENAQSTSMPPVTMQERPETRCVVSAAQFHEVNPWVLRAILKIESNFNPSATNRNANGTVDVGMAQINSNNFKELAKYGIAASDLKDACVSSYVAGWHLAKKMKKNGNTWFGIASYHSTSKCFNQRYQGLIWNQLRAWNVVQGAAIRVKTLAQCGYVSPKKSSDVNLDKRYAQSKKHNSVLAFDSE